MRSVLAADLDREQSLEAMRHAFRASKFARRTYVEMDAGVVQALLNARYCEGSRGQFLSQDPVFWEIGLSQDGRNALSNSQALNSGRTMGGPNSASASGLKTNTQSTGNSISMAEYLADPQALNAYSYGGCLLGRPGSAATPPNVASWRGHRNPPEPSPVSRRRPERM
jgi:hypothetical protein